MTETSPSRRAIAVCFVLMVSSCASPPPGQRISEAAGVPYPAVIAHRGASYDAPEATMPAYLLARDLGADYLEVDLQRTADGVLIAFHDDDLSRTTNVGTVFPERKDDPVGSFTWTELQQLDAGSWFNDEAERVERARTSFEGLRILSLEDVIDIAENGDDPPGIYIETKIAGLYPGIERELADLLERRGWYGGPGGTPAEAPVILQTFERDSLELLRRHLPEAPAVFLLWIGDGYMPDGSEETYTQWVAFAARLGAAGIGPDHEKLVAPWAIEMVHGRGMLVHAYTVDDVDTFSVLSERGVDGFFTNRPDLLMKHYGREPAATVDEILERHGYER